MPVDQSGIPAKKTPAKKAPGPSAGSIDQILLDQSGRTTTKTNANPLPSKTQATTPKTTTGRTTQPGVVRSVLDLGMSFIGRPYVWGGETPDEGFDCSGLVQYIYQQNGITLPRVAHDQAGIGQAVRADSAQPGDLVMFDNNPNRPGADHVGIYLGNGLMLQSPRTGKTIEVVKVDLGKAMTVRRVVGGQPNPYAGLAATGGRYTYAAKVTPGATKPQTIVPEKVGGGDLGSNPTGGKTAIPGDLLGIGKTSTATTPGGPLPKNATPQQIKDEVARDYGYLAAFISNPEIGPILTRAAVEDWDEARLMGALTATTWWKTTSDATRQWDARNKLDPAMAKSQLNARIAEINDTAQSLGIVLTGLQPHDIAVNSLRFGWNPAQIKDALESQGKHDPRAKTARDADALAKDDPASYTKMIGDATTDVRARAASLGVTIDDATASSLATQGVRGGWDDADYTDALLKAGKPGGAGQPGALQTSVSGLRALAASYLVPISEATLQQWSERLVRGQGQPGDFETYLKEQAKSLRPWMANAIDSGMTVAQYVDPLRQTVARELELNPESVDFTSPKFARLLDGVAEKDGSRRSMTVSEVQGYARTLDDWNHTKAAHAQSSGILTSLLDMFGKTA